MTTSNTHQEFFYEYLPLTKQARLREMIERKNDPLLLPYRPGLSVGRTMIWVLVAISLLPGLLSWKLMLFSVAAMLVALALGAVIARVMVLRFPSFWYMHPNFFISSHEDIIKLYPWSMLREVSGRRRSLTLCFPDQVFTLSCPQKNAGEFVEMAQERAKQTKQPDGDWLEFL
jgi:hypothetical protein